MSNAYYQHAKLWDGEPEPYMLQLQQDILSLLPKEVNRLLDIGCGNGFITNHLPSHIDVVGIDFSSEALKYINRAKCLSNILSLPFNEQIFDLVMANDVLEHIPLPSYPQALTELFRVAKHYVVITVPFLEDLTAGQVRCENCSKLFHKNYHQQSMGLEQIQRMACPSWQLGQVILSGEAWDEEPLEVARIRQGLGQYATSPYPLCPHCETVSPSPAWASKEDMIWAISSFLSANAILQRNYVACRTEAICCFYRDDLENPWAHLVTPDNDAAATAPAIVVEIDPMTIDFGEKSSWFQKSFLPVFGSRAYFYIEHDSQLCDNSLCLEQGQEVKVGFFSNIDGCVEIEGLATQNAVLEIRKYGSSGYEAAETLWVSGAFCQHTAPIQAASPRYPYGRLLSIRCAQGTVRLNRCHYTAPAPSQTWQWWRSTEPPPYLALPAPNMPLAFSTRFYGDLLPEASAMWDSLEARAAAIRRLDRDGGVWPLLTCLVKQAADWQDAFASRFAALNLEHETISARYRGLQEELSELQAAHTAFLQDTDGLQTVIDSLQSQSHMFQVRQAELQTEQAALQNNIELLQSHTRSLQDDFVTLNDFVETLQAYIEGLQGNIEGLQGNIEGLQGNIAALQDNVEVLQVDVGTLQPTSTVLQSSISELQRVVATLQENVTALQTDASRMMGRTLSLQADQRELGSKYGMLDARLLAYVSRLERLENQLHNLRLLLAVMARLRRAWHRFKGLRAKCVRKLLPHRSRSAPQQSFEVTAREPQWEPRTAVMLVPDDRIDRRVLLEARSLVRTGWRVTVVAAPPPTPDYHLDEDMFPEVEIVRVDASVAVDLPASLQRSFIPPGETNWQDFYWLTNHYYLLAAQRPAQVVVAHDLPVLPAAVMAAACHQAFLVYDAHELYPEQHHFGPERVECYTRAESILAKYPHQIITVNASIAREMAARYNIAEPAVVLNCPDYDGTSQLEKTSKSLRRDLNIAAGMRILLYQGSLSLNRNLENLVQAMSLIHVDDVVLVLMGPGEAKREELQSLSEQDGTLGQRVFFHDPVSQDELIAYTQSADAGIIPYPHIDLNSYYCTPNKLFDFLVANIPILANQSPELKRYVADLGVGMVHAMHGTRGIAEAIDAFWAEDHQGYKARLRDVGKDYIWDNQGQHVVNLYEALIARIEQPAWPTGS